MNGLTALPLCKWDMSLRCLVTTWADHRVAKGCWTQKERLCEASQVLSHVTSRIGNTWQPVDLGAWQQGKRATCMGITWVSTGGKFDQGSVNAAELGVMLGSTIAMTFVIWFGARWSRFLGVVMLLAYIAFLVLEFTVIRKVWSD